MCARARIDCCVLSLRCEMFTSLSLSLSISESVIITRFSRVSVLLYVAFDDLLTP